MSAQSTPVGMDISEAANRRNNMVSERMARLQHLAWRAINIRGLNNTEFVIVCIQVDSSWRDLVDALMPNTPESHWQEFRDKGMVPVANGSASVGVCEIVAERCPEIRDVLIEEPSEGVVKCIALDEGGCTVYDIKPIQNEQAV